MCVCAYVRVCMRACVCCVHNICVYGVYICMLQEADSLSTVRVVFIFTVDKRLPASHL